MRAGMSGLVPAPSSDAGAEPSLRCGLGNYRLVHAGAYDTHRKQTSSRPSMPLAWRRACPGIRESTNTKTPRRVLRVQSSYVCQRMHNRMERLQQSLWPPYAAYGTADRRLRPAPQHFDNPPQSGAPYPAALSALLFTLFRDVSPRYRHAIRHTGRHHRNAITPLKPLRFQETEKPRGWNPRGTADEARFELAEGFALTRFRGVLLRPLGHSSKSHPLRIA